MDFSPFSFVSSPVFERYKFIVTVVVLTAMLVFLLWSSWHDERRLQQWKSALDELAQRLGLSPRPAPERAFAGEYRGWEMWMGLQQQNVGRKYDKTFPILRLDVGAILPRDFVVVPIQWTRMLLRVGLPGIFKTDHRLLDKRFIFQCGFAEQGKALMSDSRLQQALSQLGGGSSVGFIEKNQVCLAYTKQLPDEATLRQHLDAMVAVASALRVAGGLSEYPREVSAGNPHATVS